MASLVGAMLADELGHWPGFESGTMLAEPGPGANEDADQFTFGFPEVSQQFAFFFRSEEVGGKNRGGRHARCFFHFGLACTTTCLHGRLSLQLEACQSRVAS